jgi:hypothetical protein
MLRSFGLILVAAIGFAESTAPVPPLTEIVVVGTVHKATTKYTVEDLIHIFNIEHPDCNLDSSFQEHHYGKYAHARETQ